MINDAHVDLTKFRILCIECGEENVELSFSEGYLHSEGGDLGWLQITCLNCRAEEEFP